VQVARATRFQAGSATDERALGEPPHPTAVFRFAYLAGMLLVIGLYPFLSGAARDWAFLVVSVGAIPAVAKGMTAIDADRRTPWWLLLSSLATINASILISVIGGDSVAVLSAALDSVGNVLALIAALILVVVQGRNALGSIVDATIVAVALGGVLWAVAVAPDLRPEVSSGAAKVNLFVAVLALCGVLGAIGGLYRILVKPPRALALLVATLGFALAGYLLFAQASTPGTEVIAAMMFMAGYTALGLFGLDPTARHLADQEPPRHVDRVSAGRLVFLGLALALIPFVVGIRTAGNAPADGLVLALGGTTVAVLVMVRLGCLAMERDRAVQALKHEASHDSLTGLPNRREFVARLDELLSDGRECVVLFCDLDGFKAVNDRFGHSAGDEVLVELARRLRHCIPETDVVSRVGGDEFLILSASPCRTDSLRQCVGNAVAAPVTVRGERVTIGASVGGATGSGGTDPDELIRRADHAMYEAKGRPHTAQRGPVR